MRATFPTLPQKGAVAAAAAQSSLIAFSLLFLACGGGESLPSQMVPTTESGEETGVETPEPVPPDVASGEDEGPTVEPDLPPPSNDDGEDDESEKEPVEPPRFDILLPDAGEDGLGGEPEIDLSYIWISNSSQGTVSKIQTSSMKEVGRFLTREDGEGDPSRTSVGPTGDVVVANRAGGITKIYASIDDCKDDNGTEGIQTSTDKDYLAWGEEECVAWHVPMDYDSQRAVAWTKGKWNPRFRKFENVKVWVSGAREGIANKYDLEILLLDGGNGRVEDIVEIDMKTLASEEDVPAYRWGAYGGAVDRDSNFWFSNVGKGTIARVNIEDRSVDSWEKNHSSYGFTVDGKGRIWTCGEYVGRFDPEDEEWTVKSGFELGEDTDEDNFKGMTVEDTGCMTDGEGRLWISVHKNGKALVGVDQETLEPTDFIEIPDQARGISIDFEGYIWGVSVNGREAYRVDAETRTHETFTGLVDAYTYSDMTGFALSSTIVPIG